MHAKEVSFYLTVTLSYNQKKSRCPSVDLHLIFLKKFAGYAGSKNQVPKRAKVEFVELHFLKLVIISNTCVVFLITEIF